MEVPPGSPPTSCLPFRPGPTYRMWLPNVGGEEEGVGGGVQESASWGPGDGNSRCLQPREEDLAAASWDTAAWRGAQSHSQTWCQPFLFPSAGGDALEPPAQGLGPRAPTSRGSSYRAPDTLEEEAGPVESAGNLELGEFTKSPSCLHNSNASCQRPPSPRWRTLTRSGRRE